jgi:hypothetical protein
VAFCLKSEPGSLQCSSEVFRAIDEKNGGFDIMFLPQFFEKYLGKSGCSGRKQPQMKNFVCLWIRSGVQPKLLVVDSNHCFVNRDLIRIFTADWL